MPKDYFPEEPFGCRCGCGLNSLDPDLRRILNEGREETGIPWVIECGCRCLAHNAAVGGAEHSAHMLAPDLKCHAVDIRALNPVTRAKIQAALQKRGIRRFEVSNKHIHADNATDPLHPAPLLEVIWFNPDGTRAK